jgi:hypothetical protein
MSDGDNIQRGAVEDHDGILTIRGGGARRNWNGIHYKQGMSAKNVGTTRLSANIATIPPGGVAYAHIHVGFELILYILEGKVRAIAGQRKSYRIVGVDELRFYSDGITWISPVGKTLLAAEVGDRVTLEGDEKVEIVKVEFPAD